MPTTYDLNPRDIALYQRSNEYLSRLNDLDPYSREYANVYNDYVDTIDQLSNRDFRASLNPTLLEFAPMTRPRVQPRAPEPVQQPRASEPVQLAPADNILYRNRPTEQQEFHRPVPITPSTISPKELMTSGQNMSLAHVRSLPTELALTYQTNMNALRAAPEPTQEVTPYGITVHNPNWEAYPYISAKSQPKAKSAQADVSPMMTEGSLPLVNYSNNATISPFAHSSSYAEALSRLSWPGQVIPITNDWY